MNSQLGWVQKWDLCNLDTGQVKSNLDISIYLFCIWWDKVKDCPVFWDETQYTFRLKYNASKHKKLTEEKRKYKITIPAPHPSVWINTLPLVKTKLHLIIYCVEWL